MSRQPAIREETFEAAADWLLKIQQGNLSAEETRQFQGWLESGDENRRAWLRVEKLMGKLGTLPSDIARQALEAPDNSDRRKAVTRLALLIAAVPLAGSLWYLLGRDSALQSDGSTLYSDYKTTVGERKTIPLSDGTLVTLNTDSAIRVQYSETERHVVLQKGEIYLETGKLPDSRPFQVITNLGTFRPLGTRFSLYSQQEVITLAVQEGAVEATDKQQQRLVVPAGKQLQLQPGKTGDITQADEHTTAWTSGMLLADALPLEQFAQQLERYRNGRLSVAPAIAHLPVSGAYPLDNTDQALSMLADAYQLRIESHWFGYATRLTPSTP